MFIKKNLLGIKSFISLILLFSLATLNADEKLEKIVIAGPFATVSHPVLHMIESGALNDIAKKVEFRLWKNPDELRSMIIKGDVDFVGVTTNAAAILKNKKVDIKLLNVSVWGVLGMISRDKTLKTLKDFKGKKIAIPFRADMPDIVFKQLLKKQGLDPKKDFKLVFVSSPIDAMQMLIMRRVDHALLAEPATSMALRKTKSFPVSIVAPDLYRSADIQKEWGDVFKTEAKIPQAGMAVIGKMKENKKVLKRFLQEYEKSLQWYKTHKEQASKIVAKSLPMLMPEAVADSIEHVRLESVNAYKAKPELEFFFNILKEEDPKSIGSKLPDDSFYYRDN